MTISGIVRFFVQISLRYKLPGLVSFKVSQSGSILRLERNDGCLKDLGRNASLKASELSEISQALNTSVSLHDLERVEADLANRRVADDSLSQRINVTTSPFSALSEPEWKEILKTLVYPAYGNVTELTQKAGDKLNDVISAFSDQSRSSALLAYAVVCTAIWTRASVALAVACPSPSLECGACQALEICEIEDAQLAAVTDSPCTNEHIRRLFARIRSSVIAHAKSHVLLKGASEQTIAGRLGNVSLALPLDTGASLVAAPPVSRSFADNLLAARSYGFDIRQIKAAHDIPSRESRFSPTAVRRGSVVYVTDHMYSLMGSSCLHKGAELPIAGVELAFHLWSFLFEHSWPTEEEWKAEPKLACLRGMYGQNPDNAAFRKKLALTLALAGTSDAHLAGKGQLKLDFKGTHVPLARYAFIVWLHERCTVMPGWMSPEEVNSVLQNVPAFASAFDCPKPKTC
ncbi:hypothetical protein HPB48_006435 [Haemaphysalis longicornis]|uniref:Uncharacterized protein n=1 Tax=Haemaphysalis longicornis TaxID=44386 RepID=A0A9J6FLN4_HAELO|nr:hypothetical protein HPB48_006435 [Haemaphysalis longicornis]